MEKKKNEPAVQMLIDPLCRDAFQQNDGGHFQYIEGEDSGGTLMNSSLKLWAMTKLLSIMQLDTVKKYSSS